MPRFTLLLVLLCAARASALTVCEEEEPTHEPARLILPCAVAEHAFLGASELSCADATIYVVTDAGVLLCQIEIPAFAATTLQIEEAPSATFSTSTAFSAAGIPAVASMILPPSVTELPRVPVAVARPPRDAFVRPPAVPS